MRWKGNLGGTPSASTKGQNHQRARYPRGSDSVGLGWCLSICISNEFPSHAGADVQGLQNHYMTVTSKNTLCTSQKLKA